MQKLYWKKLASQFTTCLLLVCGRRILLRTTRLNSNCKQYSTKNEQNSDENYQEERVKRKLSSRGLHLFHKHVLQYCYEPLYAIVARFTETTGIQISKSTGHRYIRSLKMGCFIAIQKPYLSKKNIHRRIVWARTHKSWTQEIWSRVMLTDESCFYVRLKKNRLYVRRHKGQRLHRSFV